MQSKFDGTNQHLICHVHLALLVVGAFFIHCIINFCAKKICFTKFEVDIDFCFKFGVLIFVNYFCDSNLFFAYLLAFCMMLVDDDKRMPLSVITAHICEFKAFKL